MLKRHVLYIFAALVTIALLILVCINFGKIRFMIKFMQSDIDLSDTSNGISVLECDYDINDFNDTVESINRVLEFLQFYSTRLTLDAAVGARLLQGQLQLVLRGFSLSADTRQQLEQLLRNVTDVSDSIVSNFVKVSTENDQSPSGEARLKQNLHWIQNGTLWEVPAIGMWQENDDLDLKRYNTVDNDKLTFSETDFSDQCIGAVFDDCAVPDDCFDLFLGTRYSEYLLTHAIIFLLFAKKKNCFDNHEYMTKITRLGQPDDILASFCAKVYITAQLIDMGGFDLLLRDLFCEQVMVCSMAGFQQFLKLPWLHTILSWQSKDLFGCFELPLHDQGKTFEEIYGIKKEGNRVKRYDSIISTDTQSCSAHFTGVALGALGINLRYLIESCGEALFNDHDST